MSSSAQHSSSASTHFARSSLPFLRAAPFSESQMPELRHVQVVVRRLMRTCGGSSDPVRQRVNRAAQWVAQADSVSALMGHSSLAATGEIEHSSVSDVPTRVARLILGHMKDGWKRLRRQSHRDC